MVFLLTPAGASNKNTPLDAFKLYQILTLKTKSGIKLNSCTRRKIYKTIMCVIINKENVTSCGGSVTPTAPQERGWIFFAHTIPLLVGTYIPTYYAVKTI